MELCLRSKMEKFNLSPQHHNKGFTFYEFIFLIMVLSLMAMFVLPIVKRVREERISHFIDVLEQDIAYSKHYTTTQYSVITIRFNLTNSHYVLMNSSGQVIKTVHYDKSLKISIYMTSSTFYIAEGENMRAGYLLVSCGSITYKVNVAIKSGNFNIIKQNG